MHVAHCPERVLPGRMVRELIENDRIIGGMTEACAEHAEAVYRVFLQGKAFRTDAPTAELVKLVENASRDVNIAFANELSLICDQLGLNVWHVIELANRHPRVSILQPGPGVGGHCIAVDPWFIISSAPERSRLIRTAREVNDGKPEFVVSQIRERAERFKRPVVACLGLTYKPDVDDMRESPAIEIVAQLARGGQERILVADPNLTALPEELAALSNISFCETMEAVRQADIVAVLVAHSPFRKIPREELMRRVVIDATGLTHATCLSADLRRWPIRHRALGDDGHRDENSVRLRDAARSDQARAGRQGTVGSPEFRLQDLRHRTAPRDAGAGPRTVRSAAGLGSRADAAGSGSRLSDRRRVVGGRAGFSARFGPTGSSCRATPRRPSPARSRLSTTGSRSRMSKPACAPTTSIRRGPRR